LKDAIRLSAVLTEGSDFCHRRNGIFRGSTAHPGFDLCILPGMRTMNLRTASFALLLILALPSAAQRTKARPLQAAESQQQSEAQDRQAIDQLQQDEIDGSLAFDVDKIAGTWDDAIVSMPPHSKPIEGIAANRAYLEAQRKAMANTDILGYEQTWNEVRLLGDYAYEWGAIHERIRPVTAQQETALEFNAMRILKRQPDGAWKIYRQIWNDSRPLPAEPAKPAEKPHRELKP
jgi:ketosteroid isomerase-like protein